MHLYRGEDEKAFEAVSPEDRELLTAPLDDVEETVPEKAVPKSHEMLVVSAVDNPYQIARIDTQAELDEEPKPGTRVVLKLNYQDGREGEATMVWSGERWFVDLPLDAAGKPKRKKTPAASGQDAGHVATPDADVMDGSSVDARQAGAPETEEDD